MIRFEDDHPEGDPGRLSIEEQVGGASIKVIGGGGGNAINRMIASSISKVIRKILDHLNNSKTRSRAPPP